MSINLSDIAQRAGVSPATVSRALNGKEGVRPATRDRILAIAQELQLAALQNAHTMPRTETICYVVHQRHAPLEVDPFYPVIMHGVEAELSKHGYHLLLTTISDEQMKSAAQFKPVAENRVDGVILAGPDIRAEFIAELKEMDIPVVLVDNFPSTVVVDTINSDDVQGGRLATEHLRSHGHRSIVALLGPAVWHSSALRGDGYRAVMEAAGLPTHLFHAEDTTFETGKQLMREALQAVPDLTAVFAANDAMALGAIRTLMQQQKRVPEDVAVIGFDDTNLGAMSTPSLSTVKIYTAELGRLAALRLLDALTGREMPAIRTLVSTTLIPRYSCGCVSQEE
ncbi:LacI family transcriptional regulator [Thermosporothrix hazakensis]|jgi:DNA-binding LacI/PurR family transcriptional regulator|uniref:LacI family transcriptional regulator n=1 Tax=Thermosporothrix hazakensis TaxID=644383 RepID=A0A326UJH6_THEHA|nr:LacI family DNA-binding transcriptional regulator [Thermosporothrix hazakensis]PZW29227.1 LacI family transcriptional regulator [Thermosporothrix hazakensis]GCE45420.1 LacI family transcriptional regulator [Thermosporothrix hazakensis]